MRYRIVHTTRYVYDDDVTGSFGQFHLRPRDLPWQQLAAHEVSVGPSPDTLARHTDLYGNTKTVFHVTTPHRLLEITGTSVVDVAAPDVDPEAFATPWERARPASRADVEDAWRALDFTFASPRVAIPDAAREYADASFGAHRPVGECVLDLMHRVHADFTYAPGVTTVNTGVGELLVRRKGVCQDFSHVMIAALRSMGLAARYVSGYLATTPPPGKARLVGADATHAWVGCWLPGGDWLYADPTNDRLIDTSHATVAWGRDYGDVAPVRGVIFTDSKKSELDVSVDMAPADEGVPDPVPA
ncbi:MAG: transglutaminase family protein [Thermoleophilia bacterium]|nr:transglutaminase family protein [Thermoleophilia bacterium]